MPIYVHHCLFYKFRATNVAEEINKDENIIKSEFIIVSTDEKSDPGNNHCDHVVTLNETAAVSSTTKKKTGDQKTNIIDTHQGN